MSLAGGSVTVASDGSRSGSGLALAMYDADVATLTLPDLPVLGDTAAPYRAERPVNADDIAIVQAARLALLRDAARRASAYGTAVVTYVVANAEIATTVTVRSGEGGLQRTPSPNDPNVPTVGPIVDTDMVLSPFAGALT